MIYLDNAATTFPKSESVYKAMDDANRKLNFNAGRGGYKVAREATALIDDTKKRLLELVNANGDANVVLSSSITLALNQIIKGIGFQKGDYIYVSPYEHNAVARTVYDVCKKTGAEMIELPLDDSLEIDLEKMKYMFSRQHPKCVCCIHISNVNGYILPYEKIFEESKKYEAINVLDTAQSLGIINVDIKDSDVDFLSFAGHKSLYGPMGIGGFINCSDYKLMTFFTGGTGSDSLNLSMQEKSPNRYEASSMNIVAIAGLNQALKEVDVLKSNNHLRELTKYLLGELNEIRDIKVYHTGNDILNTIGVISFNKKGMLAEDVGSILDYDYNIAVRTGYHCAPLIHKYLKDMEYKGTVRIGLGKNTSIDDIDYLIKNLKEF